jgi:hypothetical protein
LPLQTARKLGTLHKLLIINGLQSHSLFLAALYMLSEARCCPAEGQNPLTQWFSVHKPFNRKTATNLDRMDKWPIISIFQ